MNHVVELAFLEKDEKGNYHYKCGFESLLSIPGDENDKGDEKREYEIISETINQLIAMEITSLMHKDEVYIFDDPRVAKIEGSTSYEHHNVFVIGMWKIFRKIIMKARAGRSLEELLEVIGKENFERLNGIIREYRELNYYNLMDSVVKKESTPLTEKFYALIEEAKDLALMMKYRAEEMGYKDEMTGTPMIA